ncbi:MAG: DUF3105 domain-containing protein [Actinobacteria bacterium]|nr:DUF3105 domain-containing protein [Actinomycetota bacterium]
MSTHQRKPKTVAKKQRRDAARQQRAKQARARGRRERAIRVIAVVAVVAVVGGGFVWLVLDSRPAGAPAGVVDTDETSRNHVQGEVDYVTQPPAGGDHAPVWQNCGFYEQPIANENAVHSLEHGAVWIQYADDLDAAAVQRVRQTTDDEPFVLASPFPDLESPVVLSAWGKQLQLDTVDDPRYEQFLEAFVQGPQTPEPGAVCTGGTGEPVN